MGRKVIGWSAALQPPDLFLRLIPNSIPRHRKKPALQTSFSRFHPPQLIYGWVWLYHYRVEGSGGDWGLSAPLSFLVMTSAINYIFYIFVALACMGQSHLIQCHFSPGRPPMEFPPKSFSFLALVTPSQHAVLSDGRVVAASSFSWQKSEYITPKTCFLDKKKKNILSWRQLRSRKSRRSSLTLTFSTSRQDINYPFIVDRLLSVQGQHQSNLQTKLTLLDHPNYLPSHSLSTLEA